MSLDSEGIELTPAAAASASPSSSFVETATAVGAKALWFTLTAAFLGWMLDGVEIGLFPVIARPALQEMLGVSSDADVGRWMGYLTALFLFGAALGGGVFGWLGDRIGRVRAMSMSILVYSAFTGLGYFAHQPWQLGAMRFIAALGMGGQWSLGVALVMESWPESRRALLAGTIGAAGNIGIGGIAVVAFFFPVTRGSWRWIMLVGAAPALLTFFIRLFVPESKRWQKAQENTAHLDSPFVAIFRPQYRKITILSVLLSSVVLIGTWGSVQWLPLWADKITGGTNPNAKAIASMLMAAGAICGCFFGSMVGNWSRRGAYTIMCLASYGVCFWLYRGERHFDAAFMILGFFAGGFSASFYGWLPLYLPELFPTRIRATGQGIAYNFGRILAGFGALFAGQLVSYYDGSYAKMGLCITLVYLVGASIIWLAPETRRKPLPE